jgi:TolB-like protein/DNA-binding winged helix-turn-helix (wHTH) protein/tetratricopeptide (TPR) repeat protein
MKNFVSTERGRCRIPTGFGGLMFQAGRMPSTQERVHFGVFEADLRSGELFRQDRKVKLHPQAFQTLALLLEHPGTLVTREQFRQRLWSSDTFVDFDLGLNSAVKKVREALHDSADNPRFVETLPRRGYRFIAPVAIVPISRPEDVALPEAEKDKEAPAAAEKQESAPRTLERPTQQTVGWTPRHRVRWVAATATVLIALAFQDFVWRRHPLASAAASVRAISVLPLENLSGDPGQEYFVDGMTEALIANLAQISSLRVISGTSVMRYKETRKPLPEIARELNVDALVEGAVIRVGERVRIDVQLLDGATERHLWAASYERNVGEVTSVQSDIARAVTNEIRVTLSPQEQARLLRTASVDPQTYELYLKGRYFWAKHTEESIRRSIEYFLAAVQRRPDYALAYAAMAEAYVSMRDDLTPQEAFSKAKAAARTALRIDDMVAEAHNALAASLFWYDWDWVGAKKEFERALALNPNYFLAHQWYGQYQKALGWKNWAAEVKRAGELDPLSPIVAGGGWYLESGEYDKAIALLRKKLELDPNAAFPNVQIGRVYTRKAMYAEAIEHLQKGVALLPGYLSQLGYAYAMSGKRAEAVKILAQLEQLSHRQYISPYEFAIVYAGLGEKELAFNWLNEAVAKRAPQVVMLNVSWEEVDSLRSDPRYTELTRLVGLPQ